jgi:hypothetical protein
MRSSGIQSDIDRSRECTDINMKKLISHVLQIVAKLDASEAKTNRFINFSTYLPENNIHCSLSFR